MQLDGEDKYIPVPVRALGRQMRGPLKSAPINVGLACIGYGAHDLAPFFSQLRKLLEEILADKPSSFVAIHSSEVVVHVLPSSFPIEDLQDNVVSHGHRDARIVEIARIHYHRTAAFLALEGTQCGYQV